MLGAECTDAGAPERRLRHGVAWSSCSAAVFELEGVGCGYLIIPALACLLACTVPLEHKSTQRQSNWWAKMVVTGAAEIGTTKQSTVDSLDADGCAKRWGSLALRRTVALSPNEVSSRTGMVEGGEGEGRKGMACSAWL